MNRLICLLLLSLPFALSAQVDSLESKLPLLKSVEKSAAYTNIITFYIRSDLKKATQFLNEAKQFSKNENDPVVKAYTDIAQGLYYSTIGLTDSATYVLEEAKQLGIETKNDLIVIKACWSLGKNFITSGKPEKGLENLFKALQLLDLHPDKESEMKVRVNIIWAYLELKRYRDCVEFGIASIKVADPKLEWITLYMYNNMAVAYGAMGQLDSARYLLDKGMALAKINKDFQSVANCYFIMGSIYSSSGKYDLAIQQYLLARPYREKVGNPSFLISDLYAIADLYHQSGDYKKGVEAGLAGLKMAEQYNMILKFEGVYQSLGNNYEALHDYKNASKYYNLWAVAKDSVYKNAAADAIAEMQTKYESEKKQQQIVIQNTQLAKQKEEIKNTYIVIIALTIISALVFIILVLARNRFRRKQELLKRQNEVSVREAYIEATIQSQESERKRFAQDLHDSMGQLISSLRLILSSVEKNPSFEDKVSLVSKSEKILDEMYGEIRSVAFNLMPQTLIQQGLLPALQEMAIRVNQSGKVHLSANGFDLPERLEELQEISLYRVIQEWTNNTIKYSDATKIDVQLVGHDNEISITVEDNGNGFDIALLEKGEGNGWKNIQSRLNLIKAILDIDSVPGRKGTTFILQIPLKKKREVAVIN